MPERARQLARVLNLCLSVAVMFAVAAPTATAAQPSTGNNSSGSSTPKGTTGKSTPTSSTKPPAPAVCPAQVEPPQVNDDGEGDPMPPLDVPRTAVGGDRMGDCGTVLPANAPPPPGGLSAQTSWVIADQDSGDVLAAYAPHARQRPAGVIKILLAMVALRDLQPDQTIVATKADTQSKLGKVGLVADGKYTAHDLIRALAVTSATDVATAISRTLGGDDETVAKMNALAKDLKATDTRAVNPTGGDQPGMSTSAFDLAVIYQAAMKLPEFADAMGASKVTITPQGNRKTQVSRNNDAKAFLADYKGATGAKYSVTNAAKSTYVGSAERDGRRVIVSILRSDKEPTDMAESLLDYGFDLIKAKTQPVGNLGATAPPTTPGTPPRPTTRTTRTTASSSRPTRWTTARSATSACRSPSPRAWSCWWGC
ncbi:hypothetical protein GCM10029964_113160 [Kibdelosporangium lantanae]